MASRPIARNLASRLTQAPHPRLALVTTTTPHQGSSLSSAAFSSAAESKKKEGLAPTKGKSSDPEERRARAIETREKWIARLKLQHGAGWEAIVKESTERAARNAEKIREDHRLAKQERANMFALNGGAAHTGGKGSELKASF